MLDRNLITTIPDNTATTITYDISAANGTNQLRTTVLDADGNQKQTFRDVRELIKQVNEYNGPTTLIKTTYSYDPVKQIIGVTDTKGNQTTVTYDLLGRRTVINNPDTGKTTMTYDTASNVTTQGDGGPGVFGQVHFVQLRREQPAHDHHPIPSSPATT